MSNNRVNMAVIGAGGIAYRKTIPGMLKAKNCRLVAVMDPVGVERIAAELGVPGYTRQADLLADPQVDAVYIAVNHFKSMLSSNLVIQKILPVELPAGGESAGNYIFEQPPEELLAQALPRYVENQVFRAMLESAAAYNAARMTAMDAATRNAGEVIDKLTLRMNRVRQASITGQIIEIVSGAAAQG